MKQISVKKGIERELVKGLSREARRFLYAYADRDPEVAVRYRTRVNAVRQAAGEAETGELDKLRRRLIELCEQILDEIQTGRASPKLAEFLLTVILKPTHAEAVIGDLNEHFIRIVKSWDGAARFASIGHARCDRCGRC